MRCDRQPLWLAAVLFLAAFELDLTGALDAALVRLTAGQLLSEDRGRDNADLVRAGRQFLQRDPPLDALDALDIGDLLAVELDDDLRERVVLGILECDLQ